MSDDRPATIGDTNRIYDKISKVERKIDKIPKRVGEERKKDIAIHRLECPAESYFKMENDIRQGKKPPIRQKIRDHPIISSIIGGGIIVLTLVGYALRIGLI